MQIKLTKPLNGMLCSLFLLPSCVDDSYDFDNVDLTITIGGENLALPFGNTEEMFLKKFLKVEDSELLDTLTTGEYKLSKLENIDDTEVSIEDVTIRKPTANVDNFVVFRKPATDPAPGTIEPVSTELVNSLGDITLEKNDMPIDILTVYQFNIQGDGDIIISFVPEKGDITAIDSVDFSDLVMKFPDFMFFEDHEELVVDNDEHTVSFKGQMFYPESQNSSYRAVLRIKDFDFRNWKKGDNKVDVPLNDPEDERLKRYLYVEDDIRLKGTVTTYSIHLDLVKDDITMKPQIAMPDLPVSDLIGRVNPEIDVDPSSIEFDDLPDFLQDDDVRLDLTDPRIYFTVDNTTELPIYIVAELLSVKDNEPTFPMNDLPQKKVVVGDPDPIEIDPNGRTLVILSKSGTSDYDNKEVQYDYVKTRQVEELNKLIEIIPDSIQLEIFAQADTEGAYHVVLGYEYIVAMDYEIDMELSFGINTHIVYRDTMDGWHEDLKKYEIKKMVINAEVDNTIPLELEISGVAIDVDGNHLTSIDVEVYPVNSDVIAAGSLHDGQEVVTTSIVIEMTAPAGTMKEMDGLILSVYADPNENSTDVPLNSNQFLILREMKAKVPGGVTIDLN